MQLFPWEESTKHLRMYHKIDRLQLDADKLIAEYREVERRFKFMDDSSMCIGLEKLGLITPFGDPWNLKPLVHYIPVDSPAFNHNRYQDTEVCKYTPYTIEVIRDLFPWRPKRVRYNILTPGGYIPIHAGQDTGFDHITTRFIIPILIDDEYSIQQVAHERGKGWQPGDVWYGELDFPHYVKNVGTYGKSRVVILADFYGKDIRETTPEYIPDWHTEQRAERQRLLPLIAPQIKLFQTGVDEYD